MEISLGGKSLDLNQFLKLIKWEDLERAGADEEDNGSNGSKSEGEEVGEEDRVYCFFLLSLWYI